MTVKPSSRPTRAVTAPARSRSWVRAQASARTTRPPSRGIPGSRLIAARMRFSAPRTMRLLAIALVPVASVPAAAPAPTKSRPMAPESSGPASATWSSARGVGAWMLSGARPPTNPSVIERCSMPYRRPRSACASSCAMTDARNPKAMMPPTAHWTGPGRSGAVNCVCWAPSSVTIAMSTAHVSEIRISIPNSRAIGTPPAPITRPPVASAASAALAAARRRPNHHSRSDSATTRVPTAIVVSTQNWYGNSWTRRSVPGSKLYDPAGKNSVWNSSKAGRRTGRRSRRRRR